MALSKIVFVLEAFKVLYNTHSRSSLSSVGRQEGVGSSVLAQQKDRTFNLLITF